MMLINVGEVEGGELIGQVLQQHDRLQQHSICTLFEIESRQQLWQDSLLI